MVVLVGMRDAELIRDHFEKRNLGQIDALRAIPVGDVEDRLVEAGRHPLVDVERPLIRRFSACDQLASVPELDAHTRSDYPARYVDNMYGDSRHGKKRGLSLFLGSVQLGARVLDRLIPLLDLRRDEGGELLG